MARPMNQIEQGFYDTFIDGVSEFYQQERICITPSQYLYERLKPQEPIGIYKADFLYLDKYVIEIDGHDYHSSKEQREYDYKRDRYLVKNGYIVIRFMATEVFLNPIKCWVEILEIMAADTNRQDDFAKEVQSWGKDSC